MRTRTDNSFMPRIGIAQIARESKTCPNDSAFVYKGGLRDKFFGKDRGWGSYAVFGNNHLYPPINSDYSEMYSHELHHLWQSRAMCNTFLRNYIAHGLTSLIGRGNFI